MITSTTLYKELQMFKKGDVVWSITNWDSKATVLVKKLTIESFGKVQGTASSLKDGQMIKHSILAKYCDYLYHVSDVENIEEFALEIAKKQKAQKIQHYVDCQHHHFSNNTENYSSYHEHIKQSCQEVMDAEPKVIFK
jgi:hypothetical protein